MTLNEKRFGPVAYVKVTEDEGYTIIGHAWKIKKHARFVPNEGTSIDSAAQAILNIGNTYDIPVTMRFNSVKIKLQNNKQMTVQKIKDQYLDLSR